jgi:hypothetical protein
MSADGVTCCHLVASTGDHTGNHWDRIDSAGFPWRFPAGFLKAVIARRLVEHFMEPVI